MSLGGGHLPSLYSKPSLNPCGYCFIQIFFILNYKVVFQDRCQCSGLSIVPRHKVAHLASPPPNCGFRSRTRSSRLSQVHFFSAAGSSSYSITKWLEWNFPGVMVLLIVVMDWALDPAPPFSHWRYADSVNGRYVYRNLLHKSKCKVVHIRRSWPLREVTLTSPPPLTNLNHVRPSKPTIDPCLNFFFILQDVCPFCKSICCRIAVRCKTKCL